MKCLLVLELVESDNYLKKLDKTHLPSSLLMKSIQLLEKEILMKTDILEILSIKF